MYFAPKFDFEENALKTWHWFKLAVDFQVYGSFGCECQKSPLDGTENTTKFDVYWPKSGENKRREGISRWVDRHLFSVLTFSAVREGTAAAHLNCAPCVAAKAKKWEKEPVEQQRQPMWLESWAHSKRIRKTRPLPSSAQLRSITINYFKIFFKKKIFQPKCKNVDLCRKCYQCTLTLINLD